MENKVGKNIEFIKKHWLIFLFVSIILFIIIPLVVSFFAPAIRSEITADGILSYVISCISSVATILLALVALWQTERANRITNRANDISERMIFIEQERYKKENCPFVLITNWSMCKKRREDMVINPKTINICIGETKSDDIICLDLEFTNTSNYELSVAFMNCYGRGDPNHSWKSCLVNQQQLQLYIHPNDKKIIGFYTTKEEWDSIFSNTWIMELRLENRYGISYKECFELVFLTFEEHYIGKDDQCYCFINPQKYELKKYLGEDNWETVDLGVY